VFVVQRTDTVGVKRELQAPLPDTSGKGCICGKCMGGRKAKSLLNLEEDFITYAIIGDWKG
jgi:hypothetical protein